MYESLPGKIKDAAQSAMQDAVAQTINVGLNSVLATIPLTMGINDQIGIDYTLVSSPVSDNNATTLINAFSAYRLTNPCINRHLQIIQ